MAPFPSATPTKHIDRRELYTNLSARIQYLHSFLDFSTRDVEALTTGAKYIRVLIPAVVNIVYKKLLQYDITAQAFETRSTSYEGPVEMNLTESSPQIMHRKMFLKGYLNKLCSDPTKMEFWEYLDKVGMMHTGQGRVHPLHVEYVHIGVTLSFIQDVLTEAILSHPRLRMERKIALVKALSKVIWIQNDLFAKWYVRDGEEYSEEKLVPEVEPEGYLHGKKILQESGESESEMEDFDLAGGGGACPFKDLVKSPKSPRKSIHGPTNGKKASCEVPTVEVPSWRESSSSLSSPLLSPGSSGSMASSMHSGIPRPLST